VVWGGGDQSGDGTEGVETVGDIDEALLMILAEASAGTD
jgi:hypothetical protein